MMLLAAARRAYHYDKIMRAGWRYRIGQGDLLGVQVNARHSAFWGAGRIDGRWRSGRGFDMSVVYHTAPAAPDLEQGAGTLRRSTRCCHCDFLSLHAPAGPATDRSSMPRRWRSETGAVLVNVRGGLVDEDAVSMR
jgi:lactate dehydrogenase-like 2-hydroxyacid dehydrogenase